MKYAQKQHDDARQFHGWFFTLMLSILPAFIMIAASLQGKKWVLAGIVLIVGFYGVFVFQKAVKFLFPILLVFLIPLRIDYYLIYQPTGRVQSHGLPGLPITAFDILFLMLFLWQIYLFLSRKERLNLYPTFSIPAVVYIFFTFMSAFQTDDPLLSFSVLFLVIKTFLVFLLFANRIKTKRDLGFIILGLILAVLMQSLVGSLQYIFKGGFINTIFGVASETAYHEKMAGTSMLVRIGGTVGHPNGLAKYLCFCIPLLFCYAFAGKNVRFKNLALLSAIMAGFTLIMTMSRGSWLALSIALTVMFYYLMWRVYQSRLKAAVGVVLIISLMAGVTLLSLKDVRVRLFEDDYGAAQVRLPMASVATNMIRQNPFVGVGLNNYTGVMHAYDHTREWQTYQFPHPVHNSFLLIAAESGIPALLAFLWLLAASFKAAWPLKAMAGSPAYVWRAGLTASLMTWMISGIFDRDFAGANVMLWFVIAMIAASGGGAFWEEEKERIDGK